MKIATAKRLVRFGLVGGFATLLYGGLSVVFVRVAGLPAFGSHLLAYALMIPLSFVGQKRITFAYHGAAGRAFVRFVVTNTVGLAASSLAVAGAQVMGLAPLYGIGAAMIIVPVISYLMMSFWVFWEHADA